MKYNPNREEVLTNTAESDELISSRYYDGMEVGDLMIDFKPTDRLACLKSFNEQCEAGSKTKCQVNPTSLIKKTFNPQEDDFPDLNTASEATENQTNAASAVLRDQDMNQSTGWNNTKPIKSKTTSQEATTAEATAKHSTAREKSFNLTPSRDPKSKKLKISSTPFKPIDTQCFQPTTVTRNSDKENAALIEHLNNKKSPASEIIPDAVHSTSESVSPLNLAPTHTMDVSEETDSVPPSAEEIHPSNFSSQIFLNALNVEELIPITNKESVQINAARTTHQIPSTSLTPLHIEGNNNTVTENISGSNSAQNANATFLLETPVYLNAEVTNNSVQRSPQNYFQQMHGLFSGSMSCCKRKPPKAIQESGIGLPTTSCKN